MKLHDPHHRTRIVATLGPASESDRVLSALLRLGVDWVRINASHGSPEEHRRQIATTRRLARRLRKKIQILLDLPGPKLRLGILPQGEIALARGQTVQLVPSGRPARSGQLPLREPEILSKLKRKQAIFLADGTVELEVLRASAVLAVCRVQRPGLVRSGAGLNLPHTDLGVAIPTSNDRSWIRFAAAQRAEWLAVSFVQTPEDIRRVREEASMIGYRPQLMAKIEKRKALENLEAIIKAADGVMVARGDLGIETPLEEIPFAQKRIIAIANRLRKPVVTATQMLESMVIQSTPTRAEVTDIANAVLDGTDAVMLSAETAIGMHPVEVISVLSRVLTATERETRKSRSKKT